MTLAKAVSLFVVLVLGASCWAWLARQASAADAMEWQFSEASDPDNKGAMTARLVYGVPETDNIQVSGVCEARSSTGAKFSSVTFGADIGALENGKDTELRFSGGGFDHALKGQISRATGEEGLSGVHVDIEQSNPLWGAMAEKDQLDYLVPGYKAASLDLTRGRDKIQQFVKACETYASAGAPPVANTGSGEDAEKEAFDSAKELGTVEGWQAFITNYPSGFHADLARAYIKKLGDAAPPANEAPIPNVSASREVPDPPCRNRKNIRSMVSEEKTKLTFINRSGATRNILWLDFASNTRSFGRLKNGEQIDLDTFVTHPWMVTNSSGACLQIIEPDAGGRVVVLEGSGDQPAEKPAAKKATTKKSGCSKGQITVDGKCMSKNQAVGFCGPGFHAQGGKCVPGFVAPKGPRPSTHGCPPGMAWSKEEGCHEDD